MNTPDVTKAQVVAIVQAIIGVAVAFGLPLTKEQEDALLAFSAVIAFVLVWSDTQIRKHRAENADKITRTRTRARTRRL